MPHCIAHGTGRVLSGAPGVTGQLGRIPFQGVDEITAFIQHILEATVHGFGLFQKLPSGLFSGVRCQ